MKKISLIFFIFLLTGICVVRPARAFEGRLPQKETLVYSIKWIGLPVGTMTASIKGMEKINGRDAYVLEAVIRTNAVVSAIHKIDARFVSFMDAEKHYSLRFEVYRRDGRGRGDSVTEFDQESHKARTRNLATKTQTTFNVPPRVQDVLSACYYLMLFPLAVGDRVPYDVYYDREVRHMFAFVASGKTVQGPAPVRQQEEAIVIWPYARMKKNTIEEGHVSAVYSRQPRRIPLWAVVRGPVFGKATISLIDEKN